LIAALALVDQIGLWVSVPFTTPNVHTPVPYSLLPPVASMIE
jgi:hypothetical protein